ncbi:MAG: hypothetical protein HC896_06760, partial [Bacteroidales bacterium]|nr:hypothetical protein [Bacteroidales bacterium]
AGWNGFNKHVYADKNVNNQSYSQKTVTANKSPDYIVPFSYYAFARMGFQKLAVQFQYRIESLFKYEYGYADLPVYQVGLNIGLY